MGCRCTQGEEKSPVCLQQNINYSMSYSDCNCWKWAQQVHKQASTHIKALHSRNLICFMNGTLPLPAQAVFRPSQVHTDFPLTLYLCLKSLALTCLVGKEKAYYSFNNQLFFYQVEKKRFIGSCVVTAGFCDCKSSLCTFRKQ